MATIALLCWSCSSIIPVFNIIEDPYLIAYEKPTDRVVELGVNGSTNLIVYEMEEDRVLVYFGDHRGLPYIEKQWLSIGQSKYFRVNDDEYVFTVMKVQLGKDENGKAHFEPGKNTNDKATFEVATWDTYSSWCRRDMSHEPQLGSFLFGSF